MKRRSRFISATIALVLLACAVVGLLVVGAATPAQFNMDFVSMHNGTAVLSGNFTEMDGKKMDYAQITITPSNENSVINPADVTVAAGLQITSRSAENGKLTLIIEPAAANFGGVGEGEQVLSINVQDTEVGDELNYTVSYIICYMDGNTEEHDASISTVVASGEYGNYTVVFEAETDGVRSYRYHTDATNKLNPTANITGVSGEAVANMVIAAGGVSKWSDEDVQTLASMKTEGWLDKSMIPYLTYHVDIAKAGEFTLEYVYKPTMTSGSADGYRMTVSVNDLVFDQLDAQKIDGTDGWYKGTATVELTAGRNVIRMMSIVGENVAVVTDVAHDYLSITGEGKISKLDGKANWFQSGESEYINLFSTTNSNRLWASSTVGGVHNMDMTYAQLTDDNVHTMPYFAYTVEIPADGYYDMETYLSSGKQENKGYIILGIDGEMVQKTALDHTGNSMIVGVQNLTHYLTKGTHTILVSALCESSAENDWSDMAALTIYGADVKLADTQVNPLTGVADSKLEAESDGFYNHFYKIEPEQNGNATVMGFANTELNPTLSELETSLASGIMDKSNWNFIGFMVSAPEDGEYYIKLHYKVNDSEGGYDVDPYAAFVVNGEDLYTGEYVGQQNKLGDTMFAKVTLKKGVNTIYCMSLLKDLEEALDTAWTQVDHLTIDGRLSGVTPTELVLAANKAEFVNLYERGEKILGNADASWIRAEGMYIGELSKDNLKKVPHFAYTVEVAADGYYDLTLLFNGAGESTSNAIGLLVDGKPYAMKYNYLADGTKKGSGEHSADLSVYMTAGTHVLTVTMQMPVDADAAASYNYQWTNLVKLVAHGGIELADKQYDPAADIVLNGSGSTEGMIKLEAETDSFYNCYSQFTPAADGLGNVLVGYANAKYNPTLAEIKTMLDKSILDKSNMSYMGFMVDAPADGEYEIKLRYLVNDDSQGATYKAQPYVAFIVNDDALYKADFIGRKNKLGDTETVKVTLNKGVNVIYCVTMAKDLRDALDNGWADIDYLAVDDSLKAVKPAELTLQAHDAHFVNLYKQSVTNSGTTYIGSAQSALAAQKKLYILGLNGSNIGKVPYFSYTVEVPADGYYDMTLRFAGEGESDTNAFGLLVDGKAYAMPYTYDVNYEKSWKYHDADMSVYLTKGTHTLTVTMQLPVTAEAAAAYDYEWSDLLRLVVHGGVKLSETAVNPDAVLADKVIMEAEDFCSPNYYEKVSENWKYSGGSAVTNGGGTRQYDEDLQDHLDKKEQSYVEYMIEAPADGSYDLVLGVEIGGFKDDYEPYVWVWVNGALQKVEADGVKGLVQRLPLTVDLVKGINVIRVIGTTKDMNENGVWIDHDYLAIDSELKTLEAKEVVKLEAEKVSYYNHYVAASRKSASGSAIMGSSAPSAIIAGVSTQNLSLDNVDAASYLAFTVYAPADGYYTIAGRVHMDKGEEYGKLGLMVDDKAYVFGMHQNKWGDQNYAEAAVYLTKGEHVIIATGLLADTFEEIDHVLWVDYDWFELGNGLELAEKQLEPAIAKNFVRFEAEQYSLTNIYKRNAVYDEMSGGYCNYISRSKTVQSWSELKESGIDGAKTPYVKFWIDAPKTGTYTVRLGMTYKHNGKTEQDHSSFAIVINGAAQEIRLPQFTNNYCKPFPLTLTLQLEAGTNEVVFTGILADPTNADSYVNLHYDYLDVTGGLKAHAVGQRLEAEQSEINGYISRVQKSASGKSILGEEDWDSVWTNDLTLENLSMKTYMAMPWVKYNVVAEADGEYEIGIGFNHGGDVPADQVFVAMSVNEGEFQKVPFTKTNEYTCVLIKVHLKQGDNTILITGATKDHLNMPNYPSQADGTNLWIDHDYLDLAPGLSGMAVDETPAWTGDADADFRVSLDSVWGDFSGSGDPVDPTQPGGSTAPAPVKDSDMLIWLLSGSGIVLTGILIFLLILLKKKKKDKEQEKP